MYVHEEDAALKNPNHLYHYNSNLIRIYTLCNQIGLLRIHSQRFTNTFAMQDLFRKTMYGGKGVRALVAV